MARNISLVAARKDLGRIVEEVGRTGTSVNLTCRGKVVARIVPQERERTRDPLRALRGTAELSGSFLDLTRELGTLREEAATALAQRASRHPHARAKHRA